MSEVVIESVTAEGSTVKSTVDYSTSVGRFFTGKEFYAEYDVNVSAVPEAILVIPVLAQVCPVAWAAGADVHVPILEEKFRETLTDVHEVLAEMYPEFIHTDTSINSGSVVDLTAPDDTFDESGLLFTGGVDSITTFVRHREETPVLISVHGWTVDANADETWAGVADRLRAFGETHGAENAFIRSNMHSFLDTPMLQAHFKRYLVGSWYSGVGHGLGLLGLCAPLARVRGIGQLYIASTHTDAFPHPWGSKPAIDDKVQWSGTTATHDGYELTRQEKLDVIADYVHHSDAPLKLITCNKGEQANCSRCEKCCRTAVGLVLAGLDPADHGYDVDGEMFRYVHEQLESGAWIIDEDIRFMWKNIADNITLDAGYPYPEAAEFFAWLAATDIDATLIDRLGPSVDQRVVHALVRNAPYPVYTHLYPVYDTVKRHLSS